eukprot:XP_001703998.1 Hypothetical protein GL50803_115746 [Giardia lamblia ATCC 50803]
MHRCHLATEDGLDQRCPATVVPEPCFNGDELADRSRGAHDRGAHEGCPPLYRLSAGLVKKERLNTLHVV